MGDLGGRVALVQVQTPQEHEDPAPVEVDGAELGGLVADERRRKSRQHVQRVARRGWSEGIGGVGQSGAQHHRDVVPGHPGDGGERAGGAIGQVVGVHVRPVGGAGVRGPCPSIPCSQIHPTAGPTGSGPNGGARRLPTIAGMSAPMPRRSVVR